MFVLKPGLVVVAAAVTLAFVDGQEGSLWRCYNGPQWRPELKSSDICDNGDDCQDMSDETYCAYDSYGRYVFNGSYTSYSEDLVGAIVYTYRSPILLYKANCKGKVVTDAFLQTK